jgi:hypothetical protein
MMGKHFGTLSAFIESFQNREAFLESLTLEGDSWARRGYEAFWIILLSGAYGAVMGSYNGVMQALASGIKFPMLFTLSILICFPAFFILQQVLGSKLGLRQMLGIIMAGFVMTALVLASFSPIIIFFMITGGNYAFLKLLHVGVCILAGLIGMKTILAALQYACEKKDIYPKIGVTVFRFWLIILAFVGMQLAWNLRPFVGNRNLPFEWFRERESNFYLAVGRAAISLLPDVVSTSDMNEPSPAD